jgi:predicted permease
MSWLKGAVSRLRDLADRGAADSRMDEEFRFHLDMQIAANVRGGMTPSEARRHALVAFGGAERYREGMRDGRGVRWLTDLVADLRYGARSLGRRPGFLLASVLTVALGIGATTALFSVANALLLRPLPVADPDALYSVNERRDGMVSQGTEGMRLPYDRYEEYVEALGAVFSGLAAYRLGSASLRRGGAAAFAGAGVFVSGNYFTVLGVRPAVGRFFTADDEPAVVLSHGVWQSRFGGEADVIGSTLHIDGQPFTVVGVAPRDFGGVILQMMPDVWIPLRAYSIGDDDSWLGWVGLFGRLRPGVAPQHAAAMVDEVAKRLPPAEAQTRVHGAHLEPLTGVPPGGRGLVIGFVGMLLATALLVLLIASANIAGMLLARGLGRRREVAVRLAIGAGRGRIIRQLLTESTLLFLMGGIAGLGLAWWATALLTRVRIPIQDPVALSVSPDLRVLAFALVLSAVTGLLFGLVPALQSSRADLSVALKDGGAAGGGSRTRGRSIFVAAQLALAVLLLVIAGLFVRTLQRSLDVDRGFDAAGVVVAGLNLRPHGYDSAAGRVFFDELVQRVRALPGVESVALGRLVLLTGQSHGNTVRAVEGDARLNGAYNTVDAAYFETLRIPSAAGRGILATDVRGASPVAVVNETFAAQLWPGESAIGQRFRAGDQEYEVVGLVRDGRSATVGEATRPFYFLSAGQHFSSEMVLHARTRAGAAETLDAIRREVAVLNPDVALIGAAPMADAIGLTLFPYRFAATLVGTFGVLGLVLAGIGIYGVLAYHVAQRSREFGIRIALGATRRDVVALVLGKGALLAGIGAASGLGIAAGVTHFLRSFLYGVSPLDPVTFVAVPLVLLAVALLATWLPARRATQVQPVAVLRDQ